MTTNRRGFTLVEMLLVLAIGATIILLGFRQYQSWKLNTDIQQVQYNVDTLFQAMALFYRANCYGTVDASQTVVPGLLNPNARQTPPDLFPVDVERDLINTGYLDSNVGTVLYQSPYINQTVNYKGYVAQFNRQPDQDRYVCVTSAGTQPASGPATNQNCSGSLQVATVINWRAQVAVRLKDDIKEPQFYLNLLGGDCLSDVDAGTGVVSPCSKGTKGKYVVWEKSPSSVVAPTQASPYWPTNPTVEQFRQMYTVYPTTYLLGVGPRGIPGTSQGATSAQYIYCSS